MLSFPLTLLQDATGYDITPAVAARLIPAYDASGTRVPVEYEGWDAPCGTMWSSIHNLAKVSLPTSSMAM